MCSHLVDNNGTETNLLKKKNYFSTFITVIRVLVPLNCSNNSYVGVLVLTDYCILQLYLFK